MNSKDWDTIFPYNILTRKSSLFAKSAEIG